MAKLTLSNLKTLAKTVIDSTLIGIDSTAFDLTVDRNTISDLTIKIGKILMLDSTFVDRLQEFEAEELSHGTTIEEYFINLLLPEAHDPSGATTLAPRNPEFGEPFYSKELARKTLVATVKDVAYNNAMLGENELASLVATILKRQMDAFVLYKYGLKKELIGEMISRVPANDSSNTMRTETNQPSTTAEIEAFIEDVKKRVIELGTFVTDTNNLAGVISTSPSLVLLVKGSDLIPKIDIALAGAFNAAKVEIPVSVKMVESFGDLESLSNNINKDAWAVLLDPRGIKAHHHKTNAAYNRNGEGEFTNHFLHYTPVGFISNYTNIHVWAPGSN